MAMFPDDDSFTPVWTKKESLQGKHPPAAEYYFLCENILYSVCIHKKKAVKEAREYKGFGLINRVTPF